MGNVPFRARKRPLVVKKEIQDDSLAAMFDGSMSDTKSQMVSSTPTNKEDANNKEKKKKEDNSCSPSLLESPRNRGKPSSPILSNSSSFSMLSSQERLELKHWGLPEVVLKQYHNCGIQVMFPWQSECLAKGNVLNGGNLVYSAPTSAGKTLVSEILLLKRVLETKKKAIMILPFVSIAREKMFTLKKLLQDVSVRVGGFMGSHHPPGGFKAVDIAVCTIEKANSLVNRLLEQGSLEKLGIVVVDELHLLGDSSRGYLLELLLTKIQYMSYKDENNNVQIVGMSATLPNLDLLATWLNADLYKTDFRPVPLTEHIKVGLNVYDNKFQLVRQLKPLVTVQNDSDNLVYLSLETVTQGHSVLVFCPTKNWCEKLAETVAKEFFNVGRPPPPAQLAKEHPDKTDMRGKLQQQLDGKRLSEVIEQLRRCPAGLDSTLARSISFGVAYHHAGLTFDERDIIEGSFKQGIIRVLIATSTLSSGVNLPARRVIVRCPFTFQNQLIDTLSYRQMIGRAGRKGVDTEGESILLCRDNERQRVEQLVTSDLQPVASCLIQGNGETLCSSMKRAILEVIVSGVACTPDQVEKYASCTLLSVSMQLDCSPVRASATGNSITSCVEFLEENEFIRLQPLQEATNKVGCLRYVATQLGLACLASSLSPDEGLTVFKELQRARKCFVLENELHIIYQVVPIYAAVGWPNLDWMNYLSIWESLPADMKRVGELVGVEERFLVRAMRGTVNKQVESQARSLAIHQRFYTALALHDLVNEVRLTVVSQKYGASKGMLQGLQQAAATFAGMVTSFCGRLGWHSLELLLGQFGDRLQFGIQRELIDLCRLTSLNGQRARLLFNAGIESVAILANTCHADIEILLQNCAPFETGKQVDGESARDAAQRKQIRSFWVTGRKGMTEAEAAQLIVTEARDILQKDMGVTVLKWDDANNPTTITGNNRSNIQSPTTVSNHMSFLGVNGSRKLKRTPPKAKTKRKGKMPKKDITCNIGGNVKNKSFDISAQMEELFTENNDVPINVEEGTTAKEKAASILSPPKKVGGLEVKETKKKRVSWVDQLDGEGGRESADGSPPKQRKLSSSPDNKDNRSNSDIFGDSFGTQELAAMEEMELKTCSKRPSSSSSSSMICNKSCPKTPNYQACSEDLDAFLAKSDCESKNETISDSFLEEAITTHMSAFSDSDCDEQNVVKVPKSINSSAKSLLMFSDSDTEPNSPTVKPSNPKKLDIVDVCTNKTLFGNFAKEWKSQNKFSVALACARLKNNEITTNNNNGGIGQRVTRRRAKQIVEHKNVLLSVVEEYQVQVVGLAVSWSQLDAFYINLSEESQDPNDTIAPPTQEDSSITLQDRLDLVKVMLCQDNNIKRTIVTFELKHLVKVMYLSTGFVLQTTEGVQFLDPKVAVWMIQPGEHEKNLSNLVMTYRPDLSGILDTLGPSTGCGSVAMNPASKSVKSSSTITTMSSARARAVAEAVILEAIMGPISEKLDEHGLQDSFLRVEMPSIICLAKMELNGFGFSEVESERQRKILLARLEELEQEAYKLAGRSFSLTSPDDICQVLYRELRLPLNGDKSNVGKPLGKLTFGNKVPNASSNKDVLIKLTHYHKLPHVLLQWRKLNAAITKVVFPLERAMVEHAGLKSKRIYSTCQTFTATGRVSLLEPNVQNVPKDFDIVATKQLLEKALGSEEEWSDQSVLLSPYVSLLQDSDMVHETHSVSLRRAFVAAQGCLIISADYCQLELRILAHLSQDRVLCNLLGPQNKDVFKAVASKWKMKAVDQVTSEERQQAKQICYGILYGIGVKALSEQLCVVEEEASAFMSTFKSTYPGVKKFIDETVLQCRKKGHVVTMGGRRRYLPNINASETGNGFARAAAERQAINSTVQGSAADLVKKAMVNIEHKLEQAFPDNKIPLKYRKNDLGREYIKEGAHFLLQLHDELIYEVSSDDLIQVAQIIRSSMETACKLRVPTPVKVNIGPSWGELQEMKEL